MLPPARITILSSDPQLASHIQLRLHSKGYQAATMACMDSALGIFYADPPDLLIVDLSNDAERATGVVATLRNDSFFSVIPFIGLFKTIECDSFDWMSCPLDDLLDCRLISMSFSVASL